MENLEFPIIRTKVKGLKKGFDLESPEGRKAYFEAKCADEINHIGRFLENNTFIAYFLGKKSSGKGTYSKIFTEIFGADKIAHISVGDVVREVHSDWENFKKSKGYQRLKELYRGYISLEDAEDALMGRSTKTLLPTEFILALLKLKIEQLAGKSLFIDGLPRQMDQVSYSLYFRDIINYRSEPDMFILIDIPESVIEERMKHRVVCPNCQTSRNKKLLVTSKVEYDKKRDEFNLVCDNPDCEGAIMQSKEGDDKGLDPIRERLDMDEELVRTAFKLHGIPKILLRNHVPVMEADKYFDNYELTPEYGFVWDDKKKKVKVTEKSFVVKDDNGVDSFSLLAPPVVVSMLKQMVEVLDL
ncbi:MAG: nucleoside monophosphate kinase [Candidatus Woesebacteria bacterium]|jgi:adenylate kinase family enzyme